MHSFMKAEVFSHQASNYTFQARHCTMAVRFWHNKTKHGRYNPAARRLTTSASNLDRVNAYPHTYIVVSCTKLRYVVSLSNHHNQDLALGLFQLKGSTPFLANFFWTSPVGLSDKASLEFWHVLNLYFDNF
jgi:hypothetical protein